MNTFLASLNLNMLIHKPEGKGPVRVSTSLRFALYNVMRITNGSREQPAVDLTFRTDNTQSSTENSSTLGENQTSTVTPTTFDHTSLFNSTLKDETTIKETRTESTTSQTFHNKKQFMDAFIVLEDDLILESDFYRSVKTIKPFYDLFQEKHFQNTIKKYPAMIA